MQATKPCSCARPDWRLSCLPARALRSIPAVWKLKYASFHSSSQWSTSNRRDTLCSAWQCSRNRKGDSAAAARRQRLLRDLAGALSEQFRLESLPWIEDLVLPLIQGPPKPLTDTVAPEALAEPDSRFVKALSMLF